MPTHTLHLKAPSYTVQPGIADYKCFGPWPLPIASGALTHFLPVVDMSAVHHMIVYGGTSNRSACHGIHIIYAWARTGQTEPIGLDLAEMGMSAYGEELQTTGNVVALPLESVPPVGDRTSRQA